jgi:uncharacterized damage-inducible protein DinB
MSAMRPQELRTLVDYHYWARDRVLAAIEPLSSEQFVRDLGSSFPSVRDTLAHLHGAEWVWLERCEGLSPTAHLPLDRFADVPAVRAAWADTESRLRALVEHLDEAGTERAIAYTLFNGTAGTTTLSQLVQHLVNHASFHRGQLATMLRQLGAAPAASMDLIAFHRERIG